MATCGFPDCDNRLGSQNTTGFCKECFSKGRRRKPTQKEGQRAVPFMQYSLKGGAGRTTYVSLTKEPWE